MSTLKVLVVEDEAIVGLDIQDRLMSMDYEVTDVVPTGEEAVTSVRAELPDLVLMDIQLAGKIDGIEAADMIRARHNIPVVFLTANSDEATLDRAKVAGPHGYLLKPLDERVLHTTIETAVHRHQMDQKVARSETKLYTTMKSIADGIITTDAQGHIEFMNAMAERLTGWTAEEARGVPALHVFQAEHEHTGDTLKSPVDEVIESGEPVRYTNRSMLCHRDHSKRPIDESAAPILDPVNGVTGAVLVFKDTTGRRRIEEAIRESEQQFQSLCQSTDDAIILADEDGRITLWSQGAEFMFLYKAEEIIGKPYVNLFVAGTTHWTKVPPGGKQPVGKPPVSPAEKLAIRKDDSQFPVEMSISVIRRNNQWRTVLVCRDISDRKLLEEELRVHHTQLESLVRSRTHELMAVNEQLREEMKKRALAEKRRQETKSQLEHAERMETLALLAGGVAHDLNNTLVPLVGYPEVLLQKLPEDSPYRKYIDRMGRAAREAAEVIQDLLAMGRRGRYEMIPFDLNDLLHSYLDSGGFIKLKVSHPHVVVEIDLSEEMCPIFGSESHLSKCVMNLVVNAFDAMPDGGLLQVSSRRQTLETPLDGLERIPPGRYVVLSVKDTGMGINPGDLRRIFEPYFSKKKMGTSGSGLGLAVVHGVLIDHQAKTHISTEIGKGTEFKVFLPETQEPVVRESEDVSIDGHGETILVVDDEPMQRETAEDVLKSLGYKVLTAPNGHSAEAILREHRVDLILLDMILGDGVDGFPVFLGIRKINPTQHVLIVSGHDITQDVKRMLELGAGAFVPKPYTRQKLGQAIRAELAQTAEPA